MIDEAYTLGGKIAGLCEACCLNIHRFMLVYAWSLILSSEHIIL